MASAQDEAVMEILVHYYEALEDGSTDFIMLDPAYKWCFYRGEMTVERMRKGLLDLDQYMGAEPQSIWANNHRPDRENTPEYEQGPDLSRLSDDAMICMFQELDAVLRREAG